MNRRLSHARAKAAEDAARERVNMEEAAAKQQLRQRRGTLIAPIAYQGKDQDVSSQVKSWLLAPVAPRGLAVDTAAAAAEPQASRPAPQTPRTAALNLRTAHLTSARYQTTSSVVKDRVERTLRAALGND